MEINNRLDNASKKIDDTGKTFSDNTPLQNIKKAITTVKNDIKEARPLRLSSPSDILLDTASLQSLPAQYREARSS